MSLTSILTHVVRQNIRSWFKYHFPHPGLGEKQKIIVPPTPTKNTNPGEIGTALDYLIRFHLERLNKKVIRKQKKWIAERGYKIILNNCEESIHSEMCIGNPETLSKIVKVEPFKTHIIKEYKNAKKNYSEFLKTGKITSTLLQSCIFLSKLDSKFRSRDRYTDVNIDNINTNSINELKELINIVPWDKFKAKKHCFLNPNFGEGSRIVRGADADLIIDGVLIDLKSTKNFKLDRKDLNQIIGYYLLSHHGYINDNEGEDVEIKEIAIYFARYNYFWKIPLSHFYELEKYDELADEFIEIAKNPRIDLVKDLPKRDLPKFNSPDNISF